MILSLPYGPFQRDRGANNPLGAPALLVWATVSLSACGDRATLPLSAGIGPHPILPPPHQTLFPTVNIAPAKGWPAGVTPIAAHGLKVTIFAENLDHPRWLCVLPNGDVLVAETNAPARPEDSKGITGWIRKIVLKRAGAGTPSANRITLLRDTKGVGVADRRSTFLEGLNSPFGMTLVGNDLYVVNTDALMRYSYHEGQTRIIEPIPKYWTCQPGQSITTGPRTSSLTKVALAST
jgi:glucose/arabinose dehydrogenase